MPSISASPSTLTANSGNITVTLTGIGTSFNTFSTTQFVLVGGTAAAIISQAATTATSATLVIFPGIAAGTLTLVDATDGNISLFIQVVLVGVAVVPTSASVLSPGTQILTATVTNTNTGVNTVTWTVNPAIAGYMFPTDTASGVPSTLTVSANFTGVVSVTATSDCDSSQSGTAALTISPAVPSFVGPGYVAGNYTLANVFSGFWAGWVIPQYNQAAIWLQRITDDMPGATPTAAWDPKRQIPVSFEDGSYGVGWQLGSRLGYLAPQTVRVAKNDFFETEEVVEGGLVLYQGPIVLFQPPLVLRKFDVLVFQDGRYVVGDKVEPAQVMGQTVIYGAKLEQASAGSIVQTIPLT